MVLTNNLRIEYIKFFHISVIEKIFIQCIIANRLYEKDTSTYFGPERYLVLRRSWSYNIQSRNFLQGSCLLQQICWGNILYYVYK